MNLQPTLEGELIQLRPLKESDFEELYLAACDPLIWEQHPSFDRYQRPVFEQYFASAMASKGALVAVDKKTGHLIGCSRYYEFDPPHSVAIGFTFLNNKYWGGNYNKDMKTLMLNHAFSMVETVFFHIGEKNFRSQKGTEKIGAVFVESVQKSFGSAPPSTTFIYKISRPS